MTTRRGLREEAGTRSPTEKARSALAAFYGVSNFFVVRSPMLPLSRLRDWSSVSHLEPRPSAHERRTALVQRLRAEFADPELREALLFASPNARSLLAAVQDPEQLTPKITRTLTRYLMRAASRETPFGTFAGVSFGLIAERDSFDLSSAQEYRRRTNVATGYVRAILIQLAAREGVVDRLPHELNSTLSLIHDQYRYVVASSAARAISTVSLTATPQLERAVELARPGITPAALADALACGDLRYEDTLQFALTLCARGFLIPSWSPPATGNVSGAQLLGWLDHFPELAEECAFLRTVQRDIAHADATLTSTRTSYYEGAAQKLESHVELRDATPPLRTTLVKPGRLELSKELAGRFLSAADAVQRTSRRLPNPAFAAFQRRFETRYGSRYVPLIQALDSRLGLGFGTSYGLATDHLLHEFPIASARPRQVPFDAFDKARQEILHEALRHGHRAHRLSEASLEAFPVKSPKELPESFAVVARLARDPDGELLIVAPTVVSPSAASILGRFCDADSRLAEAVKRLVATEAELAGDVLLVDVAFFPHDDTANIVLRPVLRDFEIPYFGASGAPRERQIPIADLYLHVTDGSLGLYSAKHGKRIKIRLTNAHNFDSSSYPEIYRFFGALQAQDECALAPRWSWGALASSAFLPRVVCGNAVLSVATWRLSQSELAQITAGDSAQALGNVQLLRQRRELPRWLTRSEGEQRLLIDLDNELSVEELVHCARKRMSLTLEELLPGPEELVLEGPEGTFAAEFVVPFLRREGRPDVIAARWAPDVGRAAASRRRVPGSDWLYAKIYASAPQLDTVLRCVRDRVVQPLVGRAAKLWFYVPYADPEPHLRVRFAGEPRELLTQVLPRLQDALGPLLETGTVWRLQLDTYEQEEERYGGAFGISLAEQIFHADSDATSALLDAYGTDGERRWQLALFGMLTMLQGCDFDLLECADFARISRDAYALEAGADSVTWKAAGDRYRLVAPTLAALLWAPQNSGHDVHPVERRILNDRTAKIAPIWAQLRAGLAKGTVRASKAELATSFLHLHAIRMLGVSARAQEMVLYDFMRRQCLTRLAKTAGSRAPR